jgi:PTS system cellobiose-specific IIA component
MEENTELVMNLIVNAGNAKSSAMEGVQEAKNKNFEKAREKMKIANTQINKAHNTQTELLTAEANGDHTKLTLLMVHAQDHLMTSISMIDLANELIDVYEIALSEKMTD